MLASIFGLAILMILAIMAGAIFTDRLAGAPLCAILPVRCDLVS